MTYIIGDIHGEFDSLRLLVNKLPKDSTLIFVGDLIDRGRKSKEVIEFVRKNNHQCVLGNHEELMIHYGKQFINKYPNIPYIGNFHNWIWVGGKQTLLSYGLIEIDKHDGKLIGTENDEALEQFKSDVQWLETLPLYIKLDAKKDNKPIVISHAAMANVWHFADDEKNKEVFTEYALWNRKMPREDVEIFNIFGHTITPKVDTTKHYINVDTGCHYVNEGYGKLSAYCVETNEVITQ